MGTVKLSFHFLNISPSQTGGDLLTEVKKLKITEQSTLHLCSGHSTIAVCYTARVFLATPLASH